MSVKPATPLQLPVKPEFASEHADLYGRQDLGVAAYTFTTGGGVECQGIAVSTADGSKCAAVAVYNRVLTDEERAKVVNYLMDRWGASEWGASKSAPEPTIDDVHRLGAEIERLARRGGAGA